MATVPQQIPSPDDRPLPTASEFLAEIRARDGRVLRMVEHNVFVLTKNPDTASWLLELGGLPYRPQHADFTRERPFGGYKRAKDSYTEWDIYIHFIPVSGEETIWEAAAKHGPTVEGTDFR